MADCGEITTILCQGCMMKGEEVNIKGGLTLDFKKKNCNYYVLQRVEHRIYKLSCFKNERQFARRNGSPIYSSLYTGSIKVHKFMINRATNNVREHVIFILHDKQPVYFKPPRTDVARWMNEFCKMARDMLPPVPRRPPEFLPATYPRCKSVPRSRPSIQQKQQQQQQQQQQQAEGEGEEEQQQQQQLLEGFITVPRPLQKRRPLVHGRDEAFRATIQPPPSPIARSTSHDPSLSDHCDDQDDDYDDRDPSSFHSSRTHLRMSSTTSSTKYSSNRSTPCSTPEYDDDGDQNEESPLSPAFTPDVITFDSDDDGAPPSNDGSYRRKKRLKSIKRKDGKGKFFWDTVEMDIHSESSDTSGKQGDSDSAGSQTFDGSRTQEQIRTPPVSPMVDRESPFSRGTSSSHPDLSQEKGQERGAPLMPHKPPLRRQYAKEEHVNPGYMDLRSVAEQKERMAKMFTTTKHAPKYGSVDKTPPKVPVMARVDSIQQTYVLPDGFPMDHQSKSKVNPGGLPVGWTVSDHRRIESTVFFQTQVNHNDGRIESSFGPECLSTGNATSRSKWDDQARALSIDDDGSRSLSGFERKWLKGQKHSVSRESSRPSHCYAEIPINNSTELSRMLLREQKAESIDVHLKKHDILQGLVFIEYDFKVWISTWNKEVNARARFQQMLHIGDQVLQVNGQSVRGVKETEFCIRSSANDTVILIINRLPFARIVHARKSMSEVWGCEFNRNELVHLFSGPIKEAGITEHLVGPTGKETKWVVTECQHQPVSLVNCGAEMIKNLLIQANVEIVFVFHTKDFIDLLVSRVKKVPGITKHTADYQL